MAATLRLLRAEWRKAIGNFWVLGCLLGIWPLVALIFVAAILLLGLLFGENVRRELGANLYWYEVALGVWDLMSNPLIQLAVLGFAAIVFGGEYRWRTWKSIVPRRSRFQLMLGKYVVLGMLVIVALTVASAVLAAGVGVVSLLWGASYGALNGAVVGDFVVQYVVRAVLALIGTALIGSIVAILVVLSRSMLVGAIGGLVVLLADSFLPAGAVAIALLTESHFWLELLRLRFAYNLFNVSRVLQGGSLVSPMVDLQGVEGLGDFSVGANTLAGSVALLAVWLLVLVGLALWLFQRQDLTS